MGCSTVAKLGEIYCAPRYHHVGIVGKQKQISLSLATMKQLSMFLNDSYESLIFSCDILKKNNFFETIFFSTKNYVVTKIKLGSHLDSCLKLESTYKK